MMYNDMGSDEVDDVVLSQQHAHSKITACSTVKALQEKLLMSSVNTSTNARLPPPPSLSSETATGVPPSNINDTNNTTYNTASIKAAPRKFGISTDLVDRYSPTASASKVFSSPQNARTLQELVDLRARKLAKTKERQLSTIGERNAAIEAAVAVINVERNAAIKAAAEIICAQLMATRQHSSSSSAADSASSEENRLQDVLEIMDQINFSMRQRDDYQKHENRLYKEGAMHKHTYIETIVAATATKPIRTIPSFPCVVPGAHLVEEDDDLDTSNYESLLELSACTSTPEKREHCSRNPVVLLVILVLILVGFILSSGGVSESGENLQYVKRHDNKVTIALFSKQTATNSLVLAVAEQGSRKHGEQQAATVLTKSKTTETAINVLERERRLKSCCFPLSWMFSSGCRAYTRDSPLFDVDTPEFMKC